MARRSSRRRAMRLAAGIAIPAVVTACALQTRGPDTSHPPPQLRGRYDLTAVVSAGELIKEVHGVLTFLDGEWVTFQPEGVGRERVGPCRYAERGHRVEVDCGVSVEITRTDRGLVARVEEKLREIYRERQCVSWSTDASGRTTCASSREVERYRMIVGRGETLLRPLEGY